MIDSSRRMTAASRDVAGRVLARSASALDGIVARATALGLLPNPCFIAAGVLAATAFMLPHVIRRGPVDGVVCAFAIIGLGWAIGVAGCLLVCAICAAASRMCAKACDVLGSEGGEDAL